MINTENRCSIPGLGNFSNHCLFGQVGVVNHVQVFLVLVISSVMVR